MYEEEAEADEKSQEVENKMRKARGEQEQKLNNFPSHLRTAKICNTTRRKVRKKLVAPV